jgi:adenylate kinase
MRIVLAGRPRPDGSAQGALLAERLHVPHLVAEDLQRAEDSGVTRVESSAARDVRAGASRDRITDVVHHAIAGCSDGFVLEGYPYTPDQARAMRRLLASRGAAVDAVVVVREPYAEHAEHHEATLAVFRGAIIEIDGAGTPDAVQERILNGLREVLLTAQYA